MPGAHNLICNFETGHIFIAVQMRGSSKVLTVDGLHPELQFERQEKSTRSEGRLDCRERK